MNSDEAVVFNQSLNKIKKSLHSEGYREGFASGKDLKFQQGFDIGYAEGFLSGYTLGFHNGVLRNLKSQLSTLEKSTKHQLSSVEQVDKASRGLCVICQKERRDSPNCDSISNEEIQRVTEIRKLQNEIISEKIGQVLTQDYASILKSNGLYNTYTVNQTL